LKVPAQFGAGRRFRFALLYFVCYDYIQTYKFSNKLDGDTVDLEQLSASSGFEWDEGNSQKNWAKHRVTRSECEQVFFNLPFVLAYDQKHSHNEPRYYALGHTDRGRKLFVVFTIRDSLIRVISAQDMNSTERRTHDEKEDSEIRK
jgi:uncharacterized DUF497 family protein